MEQAGVKPRISVRADTRDTFQNFLTKTGVGTENVLSAAGYGFQYTSLQRTKLEAMYRGSWIVGQAVDVVAEDMTRAGISIDSGLDATLTDDMMRGIEELGIWHQLQACIKWGRLYGGALGVLLIDGHNPATPLDLDTVGPEQFRGILPVDRWMVQPSIEQPITELGQDFGLPSFYDLQVVGPGGGQRIHHSRVIRFLGVEVPYWQRQVDNGWSMSVVERLYDRLLAFDSATMGAAQLVHKAHLRSYAVEGLRDIIGMGGPAFEALVKQVEVIRLYQSNEGLTLIDTKDKLESQSYAFSGLGDIILQFAQQLSGALQIPLVRLLGQSPAGLSATGESDIRLYYDTISAQQQRYLRRGMHRVLDLVARSKLGGPLPDGFSFSFRPLWQLDGKQKAEIAQLRTATAMAAFDAGVLGRGPLLKELRAMSVETGAWTSITDEMITEAEAEPPLPEIPDPLEMIKAEAEAKAPPPAEDAPPADAA